MEAKSNRPAIPGVRRRLRTPPRRSDSRVAWTLAVLLLLNGVVRVRLDGAVDSAVWIGLRVVVFLQPRRTLWRCAVINIRREMNDLRVLLPLEDIERNAETRAADGRRIGDIDAD